MGDSLSSYLVEFEKREDRTYVDCEWRPLMATTAPFLLMVLHPDCRAGGVKNPSPPVIKL